MFRKTPHTRFASLETNVLLRSWSKMKKWLITKVADNINSWWKMIQTLKENTAEFINWALFLSCPKSSHLSLYSFNEEKDKGGQRSVSIYRDVPWISSQTVSFLRPTSQHQIILILAVIIIIMMINNPIRHLHGHYHIIKATIPGCILL